MCFFLRSTTADIREIRFAMRAEDKRVLCVIDYQSHYFGENKKSQSHIECQKQTESMNVHIGDCDVAPGGMMITQCFDCYDDRN